MSDALKQVIVLFVFFGIPGLVGAWIASTKGRSMLFWLFLCGFFPPTLMVIIFQGPLREVAGHYRQCPACQEMQAWKLTECKYCGASMVRTNTVS
jgi:hypothetical protein